MVAALTAVPYSAVYFEGRFVPPEGDEARVPLTDPGYLLGDGVFATMHGYDGVCFRAERHLAILVRGAELFGLPLPFGVDRLIAIADEAASRTRVARRVRASDADPERRTRRAPRSPSSRGRSMSPRQATTRTAYWPRSSARDASPRPASTRP